MGLPHGGWGRSRLRRENDQCGHRDRQHYAKGYCRSCYRRTPQFVAQRHKYYEAHKLQYLAYCRKRRRNGHHARKLYGLAPERFLQMHESQLGLCALCGQSPGQKGLGVDHNHETGQVRALLCARCNMALGGLRDDPDLCERAAAYLRSWLLN